MFVFITSVKHPAHSVSYEKVWRLLEGTLASVCNQTDERFKVIVVCNSVLHAFENAPRIQAHTEFVVVDYPPVTADKKLTGNDRKLDKGLKRAVGLLKARKHAPEYIMFFDADDFVGNDIVEYCGHHPGENGWYIDKGYSVLGNRYSPLNDFNQRCGTSVIIRFSLLMNHIEPSQMDVSNRESILSHVDGYFLRYVLGAHKYVPGFFEKEATPLKPFPKRAAMWLLDHGENVGGIRGNKWKLIGRTRPIDEALRRYFNIRIDEGNGTETKDPVPGESRLLSFLRKFLPKNVRV